MVRLTEEEIIQILTYFVEDDKFQNTDLLSIVGQASKDTPALDTLDPIPAGSGLPFQSIQTRVDDPSKPLSQDWLVRAFPYNGRVRVLLANTKTYVDMPNLDETRYGLAEVPRCAYAFFSALARRILLTVNGQGNGGLSTNPHGILLVKNILAIGNFKDDIVYFLKPNELNWLPDGTDYIIDNEAFFDVHQAIALVDPAHVLSEKAHGQTMFIATNGTVTYIYMVYIVYDADPVSKYPHRVL
jgi:hypothetical protein